jgi:pimeloyl-ACP methyl ester carboxylesterase
MNSLDLESTRVACVQRGDAQPLVLVHGSNSDYRTWDGVLGTLGERFRAIAYSRRYHWPNEPIRPGADYSMQEHVDDLAALTRVLDIAPAHFVGHSYGGFVCLLLAIHRPAAVRSLVLIEPPVLTLFTSSRPLPGEMLRLLLTRPRTAFAIGSFGATGVAPTVAALEQGDVDAALERLGTAVLGRRWFQNLSTERREQARANFIAAEHLGSGFSPLDDDRVRALACPVLLISGECSPRLFHHLNDRLAELLPSAERAEIPRASHIVHEDNPAAWQSAVLEFLTKHA